ncbi:MAG TPA: heme lyase CcmF/NrfE family subunit [Caulobacteraceae bacterium]|jgi:cytochrome c-type biogenesis protein CcmF
MIAELGAFCLMLALALSLAQVGLSATGRARQSPALQGAGEGAGIGAFLMVLIAFAALMSAFIRSDFSVQNVAENSHTAQPLFYKITATWGSHEGSMLLWNLCLTGFGAVIIIAGRHLPRNLKSSIVATQGALGVLFLAYTTFVSSPFLRLANPPVEGNSLNPILQDPAMAIHPPFLYSGYVGMSVVFSFAVGALIEGRVDAAWARWVRPWTLAAWSFLTVGIMLGSFWAYYELGWGGWWFWDPVENASFMPWLAGAALLHSAIVTEKRGALLGWSVFLALCAFSLSMLGAFLVRSGVLTSVHAFAVDPTRGGVLLVCLGIAACSGFGLFAWRAPQLKGGGLFAPISREGALVLNNLFLSAATATVLIGTLYPLIRQALTNEPISVGPPFYAMTFVPLMLVTMLLVPFGPLLAWKRGDAVGALQRLSVAAGIAVVAGILCMALVAPHKAMTSAGVALGAWLVAGAIAEIIERAKIGRASAGESARRLGGLPRGAWGTTLAHMGLGVFILGACFETTFKAEMAQALAPGESLKLGGYELRLDKVSTVDGENYTADRAVITATKNGQPACTGEPERRVWPGAGGQTTSKVAICVQGPSDLYVVLGDPRPRASGVTAYLIRAYWNPWARFIWLGPIMMALGGLVSLSDRRLRFALPKAAKAASPAGLAPEPAE